MFKLGDRVKIIGTNTQYDCLIGRIQKVSKNFLDPYTVQLDNLERTILIFASNLTPVKKEEDKNEEKIIITRSGRRVVAKSYVGEKPITLASAVCHEEDTFDFGFGAKIAFERLIEIENSMKNRTEFYYIVELMDGDCFNFNGECNDILLWEDFMLFRKSSKHPTDFQVLGIIRLTEIKKIIRML